MKILTLRSSVALACALSLAACGGGSGNLLLGGSVTGLTKKGLFLQNKSGPQLEITPGVTTFAFPDLLKNDEDFDVEVAAQPPGAHCDAVAPYNKGKTGSYNITSVLISCATIQHVLSGTVQGLTVDGLVLVNGTDQRAVAHDATTIKFSPIDDGAPYGVTVLTQPANQTCTINGGTGTMGSADINTLQVVCN